MKAHKSLALAGTLLLVGVLGSVGSAQQGTWYSAQQVLSRLDRIHRMGIDLGTVAQKNASSPDVKAFAQELVKFHQAGDARIKAIAKQESVTLVEPMPVNDQDRQNMSTQNSIVNDLRTLKGAQFDHAYLTAVAQSRDNHIPVLQQILPQVEDQQAKAQMSQTITQLQQQRDTARKLLAKEFPSGQ
ncbi:MAG TPA: DUF4142 domain-containing protein [Polyangia bacterium]|jgi:putative membrane protein